MLTFGQSLSNTKKEARAYFGLMLQDALAAHRQHVPLDEQLSWPTKEAAAQRHVAGTASAEDTAMLLGEVHWTGENVDELAAKILAKAERTRVAVAALAGLRRWTEEAIEAATTIDEVQAAVEEAEQRWMAYVSPPAPAPTSTGAVDPAS